MRVHAAVLEPVTMPTGDLRILAGLALVGWARVEEASPDVADHLPSHLLALLLAEDDVFAPPFCFLAGQGEPVTMPQSELQMLGVLAALGLADMHDTAPVLTHRISSDIPAHLMALIEGEAIAAVQFETEGAE